MNQVDEIDHILNDNISVNFKESEPNKNKVYYDVLIKTIFNETIEQTYEGPLNSIWLKLIAITVYFIIILSCGFMIAFTVYEKNYHGRYRTVINQLLSQLYLCVSSKDSS